uniref:C2H2-type domain-containing protein n=1 Tax=Timema tahoe TaxID=61484 RepID=A0A7R9P0M6_9NEOP|nr:unnamed protein product [Timema tahoe]
MSQTTEDREIEHCDVLAGIDNCSAKKDLNQHLKLHSGIKRYKRDTCVNYFNLKCRFKKHYRVHCGKSSLSESNIKCPQNSVKGRRLILCEVCGLWFDKKVILICTSMFTLKINYSSVNFVENV